MKKHFFLTGSNSPALSAVFRSSLAPALSIAGGYITERVNQANEPTVIKLFPAAAAAGVEGFAGHVIYDARGIAPQKDNEVFRSEGVRLLQEAAYYPFAVLDRFGGYELVVPQYRQALAELLSADLPLTGVLLSREEALSLGHSLGLGERFEMLVDRLHEALRDDPDTVLVSVDKIGLPAAGRLLQQWQQEYLYA